MVDAGAKMTIATSVRRSPRVVSALRSVSPRFTDETPAPTVASSERSGVGDSTPVVSGALAIALGTRPRVGDRERALASARGPGAYDTGRGETYMTKRDPTFPLSKAARFISPRAGPSALPGAATRMLVPLFDLKQEEKAWLKQGNTLSHLGRDGPVIGDRTGRPAGADVVYETDRAHKASLATALNLSPRGRHTLLASHEPRMADPIAVLIGDPRARITTGARPHRPTDAHQGSDLADVSITANGSPARIVVHDRDKPTAALASGVDRFSSRVGGSGAEPHYDVANYRSIEEEVQHTARTYSTLRGRGRDAPILSRR